MTSRSDELFHRMQQIFPGGVNSPVRNWKAVGGTPRVIRKAEGGVIVDADGQRLLDFVGSFGPLILGHAHPAVVEAIQQAATEGTTFGAPCERELALAERIQSLVPWLERLRFVSSGTEATMSALRLARGVTGRDCFVKFSGCYHGHADPLLVAAGSGLATFGQPSSAGVPAAFAERTLVLPLDDEARLDALFAERGDEVAAVIVEPIPANNGLLLQRPEYLRHLRALTEKHGALLIFDEVISGFRVAPGGAAERYDITPDLVTYGKVVGGGLPVGAFGGRAELMRPLAPEGPVYQAGTLSGNPLAMAAGEATLRVMQEEDGWARLEQRGAQLQAAVEAEFAARGLSDRWVRLGSLFWLSMGPDEPPRTSEAIPDDVAARYAPVFHALLANGVMLAPSAYEVGFLSLAHGDEDVATLARQLGAALAGA